MGADVFQHFIDRTACHPVDPDFGGTTRRRYDAIVNGSAAGINRNHLILLHQTGCARDTEHGRHPEFSGDVGQMTGEPALFGDHRGRTAE